MRKIIISLFVLVGSIVSAQIYDPVSWTFSHKQISENEIELVFNASIQEDWHIYSQFLRNDAIPEPTTFTFIDGGDYELIGEVVEDHPVEDFDGEYFYLNRLDYKENPSRLDELIWLYYPDISILGVEQQ